MVLVFIYESLGTRYHLSYIFMQFLSFVYFVIFRCNHSSLGLPLVVGTRIKRRFSHTDYPFGTPDNNTTIHVYVYNFTPPVEIVVSFSQYLKLNLLGFFYIFLLCFLCLLIVAAVLWKVKQKYDIYTRRQVKTDTVAHAVLWKVKQKYDIYTRRQVKTDTVAHAVMWKVEQKYDIYTRRQVKTDCHGYLCGFKSEA